MPWSARSKVELREEFVRLASVPGANFRELCRRFGVSRTTGYKWLERYVELGAAGLLDRSRRPHHQPTRMRPEIENAVLELHDQRRTWGNRKLRARLLELGHVQVPSASTIQSILRRHGRSIEHDAVRRPPHIRFERERPNELWQMDFKGHFPTTVGRCHPLTVLDDHSRYSLVLQACSDERGATVHQHLTGTFRRYGRPEQMLMDNGPPWGYDETRTFTPLTVWLIRLGITPLHGRPYHPQTQGKEERFHRTLNLEVIRNRIFSGMRDVQRAFDSWRQVYNHERPHEALAMKPPISRYKPSVHSFPERLPAIEYGMNDAVRVPRGTMGRIAFGKREWKIGKAFRGLPIAVRATATDGVYGVYFCHVKVRDIDLRATSDAA